MTISTYFDKISEIIFPKVFMEVEYKDYLEDKWIDQIIELHNKTEMGRNIVQKDFFLRAYKNRFAVITAWRKTKLIGFGSMISDGEMYSSIFDVVIDPEYQKNGIGKKIMEMLISKTPNSCINLTSTFGNEEFYQKIGFKKHKTAYALYPWESDYLE